MAADVHFAPDAEELEAIQARQSEGLRRKNVLRSVMGSGEGREFVTTLLADSYQDQPVADLDPLRMMQRASVRDFGLSIASELQSVCPELLALAMREEHDRNTDRNSA